jgi:hypothetical protein
VASKPNSDGSYKYSPTPASELQANAWTLSGNWQISSQYITSDSSGDTLVFHTVSKDVYMVAGTTNNQPADVGVSLPAADAGQYGSDVVNGTVTISGSRLYHVVSLKQFGDTTVTLTVPPNVSLYTFTFGS